MHVQVLHGMISLHVFDRIHSSLAERATWISFVLPNPLRAGIDIIHIISMVQALID